jgi:hypothetical protein
LLTFAALRYVHPFFTLHLNQREALILATLVNMQDDSGFKMVHTNNKKFDAFMKGKAMINFIFSCLVCFSLLKDHDSKVLHFGHDMGLIGLTFGSSLLFSLVIGVICCFVFAKVSSIRESAINEVLYIFFTTYLVASLGFFDQSWDFTSEELAVIFYGIFCSHYTRYNLSTQSASRLR